MSNELKTTIVSVMVHRNDRDALLGENNIKVSLDDEGGGPFLVLTSMMGTEDTEPGEVKIDFDEFDQVVEAVRILKDSLAKNLKC